jgi:hypothetical protein
MSASIVNFEFQSTTILLFSERQIAVIATSTGLTRCHAKNIALPQHNND